MVKELMRTTEKKIDQTKKIIMKISNLRREVEKMGCIFLINNIFKLSSSIYQDPNIYFNKCFNPDSNNFDTSTAPSSLNLVIQEFKEISFFIFQSIRVTKNANNLISHEDICKICTKIPSDLLDIKDSMKKQRKMISSDPKKEDLEKEQQKKEKTKKEKSKKEGSTSKKTKKSKAKKEKSNELLTTDPKSFNLEEIQLSDQFSSGQPLIYNFLSAIEKTFTRKSSKRKFFLEK